MLSVHNFSLSERFEKLCLFLENYKHIWNEEILFRYPNILASYPNSWVKELEEMKTFDLYSFERCLSPDYVKNKEFKVFLSTLKELTTFQSKEKQRDYKLTPYASVKIKEKKHHEILSIISCLDQKKLEASSHVIDLCGGKGLLGQCMRLAYSKDISCYDIDQELQDTGQRRWSKLHCSDENLNYVNQDLFKLSNLEMKSQSFILGLHTCGALSWQQFIFSQNPNFHAGLNFGCCYHRLLDQGPVLRSSLGKRSKLPMDRAALTLATRGQYESYEDYQFTVKVKSYRYMFHLFLYHQFDIKEFQKLGTSHKSIYRLPFSDYAKEQLQRLQIPFNSKIEKDLNNFWSDQKYQNEMKKMYFANRIRTFLARPVECLILIDRALYLQEQGFKAQIHSWFDPKISPRNLGISYSK